eukprot:g21847.t1
MEQPHSAFLIAACVAAVHSAAALVFAYFSFSVQSVACSLPLVLFASALAARAIRGDPVTLKGIEIGLGEKGLFHQLVDVMNSRQDRPRFLFVAMPINHFGERIRWSLDLIGAPYEEYTSGGLISAFLRGRSVPQLIDRKSCSMIGNSDECLAYLSAAYVPSITNSSLRSKAISFLRTDEQTMAWDVKLNQLGHLVQGWAYFYVPDLDTTPEGCLIAWGAYEPKVPFFHRLILQLAHPFLRRFMRMAFDLSKKEVQAWLQTIIIKIGLCPWAKTADEAGGIRVVTSLASSPEDALLDLKAEAAKLKGSLAALPQGCPTTTLLVCPMVGEWEEFARFSVFREEELLMLCRDYCAMTLYAKVVCFHPHQQASNSYGLNPGDEILVAQNGEQFSANVLEISGSTPRDIKVQLFGRVRQGETDAEMVIEPFLDSEDHIETIPEVDVLQLIGRDALQDEEGSRSILGRAPRVVLHLLRCKDLEAIDDKKAFETLERNEEVVEELGLEGFDELLERCG